MFALTMPHITEEIYQDYFRQFVGEESIHLTINSPIELEENTNIIANGDEVVELVGKIRAFKSEKQISMKVRLESMSITTPKAEFISSVDYDIKAVGGIQNLIVNKGEANVEFGNIVEE